jgi:hypothetical protein
MKRSETSSRGAVAGLRRVAFPLLVAMLAASPALIVRAAETPPALAPPADPADLSARAMRWFTEMMTGRTDRAQYAAAFAPQVTDAVVAEIAQDLSQYGAAPLRAEIVQTKKDGDQTFATVKFVFPRGDATSLLFGFDAAGKITGIAVGGMAGD